MRRGLQAAVVKAHRIASHCYFRALTNANSSRLAEETDPGWTGVSLVEGEDVGAVGKGGGVVVCLAYRRDIRSTMRDIQAAFVDTLFPFSGALPAYGTTVIT